MMVNANAVQRSFWTEEEIVGMSSTAEIFLSAKGRRFSYSRSMKKPTIFRANIFDSEGKKIWFGDIEIEKEGKALLSISEKLGPLYILDETDARFLSKSPSARFIRHIAMVVVEGGNILYSRDFAERLGIIKRG